MIVMKFGGTSNQDAAAMKNVVRIVKGETPRKPVVVISAVARATNELEQMARTAAGGNAADAEGILERLFSRHATIVGELLECDDTRRELLRVFDDYRRELELLIQGVTILRELTPRTMDAFCSYGERLSSRLIAAGLREEGVDAVWIDAREIMLTDDNFGRALPLMEETAGRLENHVRPLLDNNQVPVTQGFIGVTRGGDYTTMGRESSDYSASIIGAAMDADEVQIWTDVDGILTADPTVVRDVRKIRNMSFEEAFELSYFGAKVLHANTMLPVLEKGIPVRVRNSKREEGTGTTVDRSGHAAAGAGMVKSIAYKADVALVTVSPGKRTGQYLFWEGIYSILTRRGISTGLTATSEYSLAFVVDGKTDTAALVHDLQEFGRVEVFREKGSICVVGHDLRGAGGVLQRAFGALDGIPISMVSYGASALNLTLVIDAPQMYEAVRRLHREFFERQGADDRFEKLPA